MKKVTDEVVEKIIDKTYDKYKRQWCRDRGFSYAAVAKACDKNEEYRGQMYVCRDEFIECELNDIDTAKVYLEGRDFEIITAVNCGRIIETLENTDEILDNPQKTIHYENDLVLAHIYDEGSYYNTLLLVGREDGTDRFYIVVEDNDVSCDYYPEHNNKKELRALYDELFKDAISFSE